MHHPGRLFYLPFFGENLTMRCSFILRTLCFFFVGLLLVPSCPAQTPPESKFFSTIAEERFSTYQTKGKAISGPPAGQRTTTCMRPKGVGQGFVWVLPSQ